MSPQTTATIRLKPAQPFDGGALLRFLGHRCIVGVEVFQADADRVRYARTLLLPGGPGFIQLTWAGGELDLDLGCGTQTDQNQAVASVAHLADLDCDPCAVDAHLGADPILAGLAQRSPGLRVPGVVDAHELIFRTMIGQQISLAGAASSLAKLTRRFGAEFPGGGPLSHLFPRAEALAAADPESLPMPRTRGRALVAVAAALAEGRLVVSLESDPAETRQRLLECRGIGPWTADYVVMRALHAPNIVLTSDLVIKRELGLRGVSDPGSWSPYGSYATLHLWHAYLTSPRSMIDESGQMGRRPTPPSSVTGPKPQICRRKSAVCDQFPSEDSPRVI